MTFNELLELDKEAEHAEDVQATPEKLRVPKVSQASDKPVPSPAPPQPKPKAKPIATKHDTERGTTIPRRGGITTPATVKGIRKAVKQAGKEAGNYRFTREEKDAIAELVFSYGQQGIKTSANEIIRIGTNWLLEDYRFNRKQSTLHKVLAALNA